MTAAFTVISCSDTQRKGTVKNIDNIIVAALSLLGTLAGAYIANRKSAALVAYRLEQLEKKVDKHNTVIERTYALEKKADVFEEKIKFANNRISDLEASGKGN